MATYVNVLNRTAGGKFILEGRPKIVRRGRNDMALVDFGDGPVHRFVDPNAQGSDVHDYIAQLNSTTTGQTA